MRIKHVTSLDAPGLDVFAHLTEAQLRSRIEPEQGIFIAESPKVVRRALEVGVVPLSFLMEEGKLDSQAGLLELAEEVVRQQRGARGAVEDGSDGGSGAGPGSDPGANPGELPVFVGSREVLASLTGFKLTRGVLCAMRRPALPEVRDLLDGARTVAVLDGIVDHTNVGALFRSAAAFDVDAVLVTPTCCDPLYRRSVRVSMGTVFQVPWTRIGDTAADWPEGGIEVLHAAGFTVVAMALADDTVALDDPSLAAIERLAVVFGTEGDGLSRDVIEGADIVARIPMSHGVDSLNVAAAGAVTFWELCRR